ncbi:Rv0361 family membrane protein [Streptomyces lydicus]
MVALSKTVSRILIAAALAAVPMGCSDKGAAPDDRRVLEERDQKVDQATRGQISTVTAQAIGAYNNGDLTALLNISCGQLKSELEQTRPEAFGDEAKSDTAARGPGNVTDVSDIKVVGGVGSAAVTVRYARHVEGLDSDDSVRFSATYQKEAEVWRLCGLN